MERSKRTALSMPALSKILYGTRYGLWLETTARLREAIGKQACTQPVAHVASAAGVGPRFVQECFQTVALQEIERGLRREKPRITLSFTIRHQYPEGWRAVECEL